jgi:cyanate permease
MLFGVWCVYFAFGLTASSMAPLVNQLIDDFDISHSAMGAILAAWPLFYLGAALPGGILIDRLGLRRALLAAVLLIAFSALLRAVSTSAWQLFLAVGVFGLGGPLVSVGAPKLISYWFEGKERGLAVGIYMTGPALGGIASLSLTHSLLMPFFDDRWRYVLLCYAIVVLLMAVVWWVIGRHPRSGLRHHEPDAHGEGTRAVFVRLLKLPAVQLVLLMSVGIFMFNHGLNNWLPAILVAKGIDEVSAGYLASVPTLVGIAGALIIPRLAVPHRRLVILAILFVLAASAALMFVYGSGSQLLAALFVQGIARSAMMPIAVLLLMELPGVGKQHMGIAGGMFFTAAEIGGVSGPLAIGIIKDASGGFTASMWMLAVVCVLLMMLLLSIRRHLRPVAQ